MIAPHLFVSDTDGALYDTREPNWSRHPPVRARYRGARSHKTFDVQDIKAALRAGPWAWPGGYPLYFVTADGCALSFAAVRQQFASVARATMENDTRSGWRVIGLKINYEDPDLYCEHTGERIQSAYAED